MSATEPRLDAAPAWAATAQPLEAFLRGLRSLFTTPGYVLFASALGFGALVRELGLSFDFAVMTSVIFYALPAQLVLADQLGRGSSLLTAAFAVTLTGVRMTPMTITLAPLLRDVRQRRWLEVFAVHFIAVTAWLEGHRRLGPLPVELRLPHFLGFGSGFMIATFTGAGIGWLLAGTVPQAVSAGLMSFTPIYFLLSMIASARLFAERLAILLGVVVGPLVYLVAPDFDLLAAGLGGGTVAYLVSRGIPRGT